MVSIYPKIMAEAVLLLKDPVLFHTLLKTFCGSVEVSFEKVKREITRCSVRCFIRSIQRNSLLRSTICLYFK